LKSVLGLPVEQQNQIPGIQKVIYSIFVYFLLFCAETNDIGVGVCIVETGQRPFFVM